MSTQFNISEDTLIISMISFMFCLIHYAIFAESLNKQFYLEALGASKKMSDA